MIAVVIPAYDAARFLPDAIASVRAQTGPTLTIVVVDDGSTDGTAELAERLGSDIRVVRQTNQGPAAARNAGVAACDHPLIAFLDADDVWPEGRIATLYAHFEADPSLRLLVGRTQLVVDAQADGVPRLQPSGPPWHAPVFGSTLIHREAFDLVGPLDSAVEPAEDMDWFIRARERGLATGVVPETTLLYRLHGDSLTSGADPIRRNMLLVLKRSLDRRREGGLAAAPRLANWLPNPKESDVR